MRRLSTFGSGLPISSKTATLVLFWIICGPHWQEAALALSFNPGDASSFDAVAGSKITVTWSTKSGDPANVLLNLVSPTEGTVATLSVPTDDFSVLYPVPENIPSGGGYVMQFVDEGSGDVLASTDEFGRKRRQWGQWNKQHQRNNKRVVDSETNGDHLDDLFLLSNNESDDEWERCFYLVAWIADDLNVPGPCILRFREYRAAAVPPLGYLHSCLYLREAPRYSFELLEGEFSPLLNNISIELVSSTNDAVLDVIFANESSIFAPSGSYNIPAGLPGGLYYTRVSGTVFAGNTVFSQTPVTANSTTYNISDPVVNCTSGTFTPVTGIKDPAYQPVRIISPAGASTIGQTPRVQIEWESVDLNLVLNEGQTCLAELYSLDTGFNPGAVNATMGFGSTGFVSYEMNNVTLNPGAWKARLNFTPEVAGYSGEMSIESETFYVLPEGQLSPPAADCPSPSASSGSGGAAASGTKSAGEAGQTGASGKSGAHKLVDVSHSGVFRALALFLFCAVLV
ncbi:BTB domain-containing protein [Mycena chlorophos]|uniref:BTB domain-containing protein n=1 Tax=Mycena chlorophos TaxID=658473 RepID=A0A8H6WKN2_MYCCL|nr:BTB domain-containing protein [Mycena chlorophos]